MGDHLKRGWKKFTSRTLKIALAVSLLLVLAKSCGASGAGGTGSLSFDFRAIAASAGKSFLEQIWNRFYPAPEIEEQRVRRLEGEADPSYRWAMDMEAFVQEHEYLAVYGNEESGWNGVEETVNLAERGQAEAGSAEGGQAEVASAETDKGGMETEKEMADETARDLAALSVDGTNIGERNSQEQGIVEKKTEAGKETRIEIGKEADVNIEAVQTAFSVPGQTYQLAQLMDYDFLMSHFYNVHTSTTAGRDLMNAKKLLSRNFQLFGQYASIQEASVQDESEQAASEQATSEQEAGGGQNQDSQNSRNAPQILIYHTHSQESYEGSGPGETVAGVGTYLASLLEEKGFSVYHDQSVYDVRDGKLDRNKAYTYALEGISKILDENPSIQVVIDLHRDGVQPGTHLVTEINGKSTARIMFFNGLSQTPEGPIPYLDNPYREDNLAFSLQLQLKAAAYYPGLARKIYLKGLRYNQHLRPCSCLIEVGAQTNTYEEARNAMEPLAEVFSMVLRGN